MAPNIFERARQLDLPLGEYVVVGGAMEAHGIRPANDIDVVVTPKLWTKLLKEGWRVCACERCLEMRAAGTKKQIMKADVVDILSEYSWFDKYHADTLDLIKNADVIDGIPFVQLTELLRWKRAAGREKDVQDAVLIEEFLANKK